MMSCFQSRRLSSRSSVRLLRCALIVAVIACFPLQGRYAVAYVQLVRLRRRATRFLIRNYLSYVAFGSETDTATTPVDVRYSPESGHSLIVVDMTTWREAASGGMWKQKSGRTQASAELGLRYGDPDVSARPAASGCFHSVAVRSRCLFRQRVSALRFFPGHPVGILLVDGDLRRHDLDQGAV